MAEKKKVSKAPKRTAEWGANEERTSILAHVRYLMTQTTNDVDLKRLEEWILQRNERYNAKPGGLGK